MIVKDESFKGGLYSVSRGITSFKSIPPNENFDNNLEDKQLCELKKIGGLPKKRVNTYMLGLNNLKEIVKE